MSTKACILSDFHKIFFIARLIGSQKQPSKNEEQIQEKSFINTQNPQFYWHKTMNYRKTFFVHEKTKRVFGSCLFDEAWCLKPYVLQGFCNILGSKKKTTFGARFGSSLASPEPKTL